MTNIYEFAIIHGITYGQCNGRKWWNVIVNGDVVASITEPDGNRQDAEKVLLETLKEATT